MNETIRKKLESPLRRLHDDVVRAARPAAPDGGRVVQRVPGEAAADIPERVGVTVRFTGPRRDLEAAGFEYVSGFADPERDVWFASGSIASTRLAELAAVSHVQFVYGGGEVVPALDHSAKEVGAVTLRQTFPEMTGTGVVVGVIDDGIDWSHRTFTRPADPADPDGVQVSRIAGIWDQSLTALSGEMAGPPVPAGFSSGVVYTRLDVDNALRGAGKVRATNDGIGHGTHVAGIAAGDGSPGACCVRENTYVGIAPDAEILFVRLTSPLLFQQALDWMRDHPAAQGKPLVINVSLAFVVPGGRDGTHPSERAIGAFVQSAPGRVVTVAMGNFAKLARHAAASVPSAAAPAGAPGTVEFEFQLPAAESRVQTLDFWYPTGSELGVELVEPGGNTSGVIPHGMDRVFVANPAAPVLEQVRAVVDATPNHPDNGDHSVVVRLMKPARGLLPAGTWRFRFHNAGASAVDLHGWLVTAVEGGPKFVTHVTEKSTFSIPASSRFAISVANYVGPQGSSCMEPDISETSSRGPVRRDAVTNAKPDLAAPGTSITSAKANGGWFGRYHELTGTSQAAPHVAGAVALMLQETPTLTWERVKEVLFATVRPRPADGDPDEWGAGKLAVDQAVALLKAEKASLSGETSRAAMPFAATAVPAGPAFTGALMAALRTGIRGLPDGELYAWLVSRHFSEVRRLIRTNRRVAALWQRADGPRIVRRLVGRAGTEAGAAAAVSDGQRAYLELLFDQLRRYGGSSLAGALEIHGPMLVARLDQLLGLPRASSSEEVAS